MIQMNTYRVFLIDDHPVTLSGLRALFTGEPDLLVDGSATSSREAIRLMEAKAADLAILDVGIGGVAGLDLIQDLRIRVPKLRILCFSGHEELFYAERALRAGAFGYLMKTATPDLVIKAARTVLRGQVYLSDVMGRRVLGRIVGAAAKLERAPISSLSNRELQIIHHIGESRDNRQIARLTGVSLKTVEAHRSRIKDKLSLRSTSDLIRFATHWVQREDSFLEG
ncbi:response regulator transcription factor [Opitutales bacterium ASA1]|uniref:response regulator n=1 Tax=Congregicoccus parvus TaxID=3081749 RepID=UPI002B2F13D4|nr:response regulator transcription factor [Opitutales bacterium ASA1]